MGNLRDKLTKHLYRAQINVVPPKESPDALLGELFQDVQLRRIFVDSITFADMVPAKTLRKVLKEYRDQRQEPAFDLAEFVQRHFKTFFNEQEEYTTNPNHTVEEHIEELWDVLTREMPKNVGSLVGLPHPYVVCGGRYIAQYYWDSYFIMIGLAASGRWDMVENMIKNCAFLIRKFGFVPNSNRTYYNTRSQPPVFSLMLKLLAEHKGKGVLIRYLPYLQAEYNFWMRGQNRLSNNRMTYAHTVRLPDGSVLNRYYDFGTTPRPEGYKEDVETALRAPNRAPSKVYLDLRAGAESGWDFSSRWLKDSMRLETIHTTDIVPVDLNSLLAILEQTLAEGYGMLKQLPLQKRYEKLAEKRVESINKYCWDKELGFYRDYDIVTNKYTHVVSLAAIFPLFAGIASQQQADWVATMLEGKFLKKGGLVTTLETTGQQWDAPNGWSLFQWLAVKGLRSYGHNELAEEIKKRWIATNMRVYNEQGKLVEKYNVVDPSMPPTNGEYVLQDGFGWTNGVLLALLREDQSQNEV